MTEPGVDVCSVCGQVVAQDALIMFGGQSICVDCKPAFFDRIRAGHIESHSRGTGGTTPVAELALAARTGLAGRWVSSFFNLVLVIAGYVVAGVIWLMILGVSLDFSELLAMCVFFVGGAFLALSTGPALVGLLRHFLALSRGEAGGLSRLFSSLEGYGRYCGVMLFIFVVCAVLGFVIGSIAVILVQGRGLEALDYLIITLGFVFLVVIGWLVVCGFLGVLYRAASDADAPLLTCIKDGFFLVGKKQFKLFLLFLRVSAWVIVPGMVLGGVWAGLAFMYADQATSEVPLPVLMTGIISIGVFGGYLIGLLFWLSYLATATMAFCDDLREG